MIVRLIIIKKIEEKIEQNYNGKRKIRKDAVKHIDGGSVAK